MTAAKFSPVALELKAHRSRAGITQLELTRQLQAAGLKFHPSTIAKIELGSRATTFVEVAFIARILDIDLNILGELVVEGIESDLVKHAKQAKAAKLRAELAELEGGLHE